MNSIRLSLGFGLLATAVTLSAQPAAPARPVRGATAPAAWVDPSQADAGGARHEVFASKVVGAAVSYHLYLPPDYATATDRRYPVVYWLHGRGGSQTGVSGFTSRLDAAIKAGKAPAMIVVGVNGMRISSWVDSFDGKTPVQSMLIKDLIPHIDASYRTIASREGRAVEGFSMGGAGAPKVGFKYPELFGTVGIVAGALHTLESYTERGTNFADIYGSDKDYFEANSPWHLVQKNAEAIRGRTFVRVAVGDKDNLLGFNTQFHELLTKLKIEHEFTVVPGATHNPGQVYDGLGDQTWAFYTRAFANAGKAVVAAGRESRAERRRPGSERETPLPAPTHANVAYGAHERHVFDLWLAKSERPAPLVLFIHGGGFISGGKEQLNPSALRQLLEAGVSVASLNYRLLSHAPLPAAQADVARALQFIRSQAAGWNIDKTRVGAFGGSAGAQLSLYLALHDDLARPEDADPIARESTRLTCAAPTAGQCTMDFDWWVKNVPGYDRPMRDTVEIFGAKSKEEAIAKDREISARFLVTKDDPALFLSYAMAPGQSYPDDPRTTLSWKIHHIVHGQEIKRLCDAQGVEAVLSYPGATTPYTSATAFLVAKLTVR